MSTPNPSTVFAKHVCQVLASEGFILAESLQRDMMALADTDYCSSWTDIWHETTRAIYLFNMQSPAKASRTMTALAMGVSPMAASYLHPVVMSLARESRPQPFDIDQYVIETDDDRYALATYLFIGSTSSERMPTLTAALGKLVNPALLPSIDWNEDERQRRIGIALFGDAWDALYGNDYFDGPHIVEHVLLARPPFASGHPTFRPEIDLPSGLAAGA